MNMQHSIEQLQAALTQAEQLDSEQRHDEAAALLRQAITAADEPVDADYDEAVGLEMIQLVQRASQEEQRQLHRHALKQTYLNT